MRFEEMGTVITRSSNILVFFLQRNPLTVRTSSGEHVLSLPHFQMLSTSRTLGKEKRDQKIPQRNFIISEEWLASATDWNKLEASRHGTNFH